MRINLFKITLFLLLGGLHITWLVNASRYITPELVFPVWLISNAKNVVSEVLFIYPPTLFYMVSAVDKIFNSIAISTDIIQLTFVLIIDALLFSYLDKKFGFKPAIVGLLFYIPWQVFFRGNYLWYDFATIPFIALAFFSFNSFIVKPRTTTLLTAATFLSLGYFFKNTVLWIFIFLFLYLIYITISKKKSTVKLLRDLIILISPLCLVVFVNFLFLWRLSNFDFAFHWFVIIQNLIYPRMSNLPSVISGNYYYPLFLVVVFGLASFVTVEKFSKISTTQKRFLYIFTAISLANILPRWSDFRVQPFLFFLTIAFSAAIYARGSMKKKQKLYFTLFIAAMALMSFPIFVNRVIAEKKGEKLMSIDYVTLYAPKDKDYEIKGKSIFSYDFSLYNSLQENSNEQPNLYNEIKLGLVEPDKYYKIKSQSSAIKYVKGERPDIIVIPPKIRARLVDGNDLTNMEKILKENYFYAFQIANTYFFYKRL